MLTLQSSVHTVHLCIAELNWLRSDSSWEREAIRQGAQLESNSRPSCPTDGHIEGCIAKRWQLPPPAFGELPPLFIFVIMQTASRKSTTLAG